MKHNWLSLLLLLLAACSPASAPINTSQIDQVNVSPASGSTPQIIHIFASPITQPWLSDAYNCAQGLHFILSNGNDPAQAEISIRLGEPAHLSSPAFQIGQDDLLVVTHRESPLQNLSQADVQNLFSNPDPAAIQIWVFAAGEDVEQVFVQNVMNGHAVTSLARVALNPQQMSDNLNQDKNAAGFLTRHWKAGSVRDIYTLPNVPVLAIVKTEPQGPIKDLLACLQK